MQAHVGDRISVPGRHVGAATRSGEVIEMRDGGGKPPYLVRWDDGHEALCYPPPEVRIESGASAGGRG